jgi:hypothetical protein
MILQKRIREISGVKSEKKLGYFTTKELQKLLLKLECSPTPEEKGDAIDSYSTRQ